MKISFNMPSAFVCLLMFPFLLFCTGSFSQPGWDWVRSVGGIKDESYKAIAIDHSGNVYVTGTFWSPSITFGSVVLTNAGTSAGDLFVVKYDSLGTVLWAKSLGGPGNEGGYGIKVGVSGDVYVSGFFSSPSLSFGGNLLQNAGNNDILLLKFDASGNKIWGLAEGGSQADEAECLALDDSDNIIIGGKFSSPSLLIGQTNMVNQGSSDLFVAKYDSSGAVLWATTSGGNLSDGVEDACIDLSGNIYISGYYTSAAITFGSTTHNNVNTQWEFYVTKYDPAGNCLWSRSANGTAMEVANKIAVDSSGNVIVAGAFSSTQLNIGSTTLISAGNNDIFLLKYDAGGSLLWANSAGTTGTDEGQAVCTDDLGNIYLTGTFDVGTLTLGTIQLSNTGSPGSGDIFIVQFNTAGVVNYALSAGGNLGAISAYGIEHSASDHLYVVGYFAGTVTIGTNQLTGAGMQDAYIARIAPTVVSTLPETDNPDKVVIYPNPATDYFYIYPVNHTAYIKAEITDVTGKVTDEILQKDFGPLKVSTENYRSGVYFVRLYSDDISTTRKIIIKNGH